MKCPNCNSKISDGAFQVGTYITCGSCFKLVDKWEAVAKDQASKLSGVVKKPKYFRPKHYKKGNDTFAWAEDKFDLETNLAICQFNIHKYNDREKGQNKEDLEKIIVYAQRALDLIKEDKMEVTFDEQS